VSTEPAPEDVWVVTDAPEAYDYGYTTCVAISGRMRLVRIHPEGADYQCARYESGMYVVKHPLH
jgi:hypothetical protein